MIPTRWHTLQPYLDEALDADAVGRAAILLRLQAQDASLADVLRSLLVQGEEAQAGAFLEAGPGLFEAPLQGQRLGAYTLERALGEGGMGSVWLARRHDGRFEGQVAIKLLNAALLGPHMAQRFQREGQILARLSHPHIARLLDAGVSPNGQPYLVLEHVNGQRIDAWCDTTAATVAQRVRLFITLAQAVAHAHQHLVVHRDIKAANVLVNEAGEVKLLDFGIAKLLGQTDTAQPALTQQAGSLLTPGYAAPEQWQGGAITTATDVYALGVLLHLLLTGQHPFQQALSLPAQAMQAALGGEAPRLLSQADAGTLPAAACGVALPLWRRALKGDLERIVAKAMQREPGLRYLSAGELADDLQRYLRHEPVWAVGPSLSYRFRRFVRRRALPLAGVTLAVLGMATLGYQRFAQERLAQEQAIKTASLNGLLQSLFDGISPDRNPARNVNARTLLDQARAYLDRDPGLDAETRVQVRHRIAGLYTEIGAYREALANHQANAQDALTRGDEPTRIEALWGVANLQLKLAPDAQADKALAVLEAAVAASRTLAPGVHARARMLRAEFLVWNDASKAASLLGQVEPELQALQPADLELLARVAQDRGTAERELGHMDSARQHLIRAIELQRRRGETAVLDRLNATAKLAAVENWTGRHHEAAALVADALPALRERLPGVHPLAADLFNELAVARLRLGQFAALEVAAKALHEQQNEVNDWAAEQAEQFQARAEMYQGRPDKAIAVLTRLLAKADRDQAEGRDAAPEPYRRLLGEALLRADRPQEALPLLERAEAAQLQRLGTSNLSAAMTRVLRGCALARLGHLDQAKAAWQAAMETFRTSVGVQHPYALAAASYLALVDATPVERAAMADKLASALAWQPSAIVLTQWLRSGRPLADWARLPVVL